MNALSKPLTLNCGMVPDNQTSSLTSVHLSEEDHLAEHCAIYGGTGRGKSRLLAFLLRQLIHLGRGFCLLDPHGDLAEDLAAYIQLEYRRGRLPLTILKKVHYLEPAGNTTFSFDPFLYPPGKDPRRLLGWLEAQVDATALAVLRTKGTIDFKEMSRLERWMKTALFASGFPLNDKGTHLGMSDALLLLNPRRYEDIYSRIVPRLPEKYRANLEMLKGLQRPMDRLHFVESTENWLGSFLSAPVRAILSRQRPSINFYDIMQSNGIILANLRKTDGFSAGHGNAVGSMILNAILNAAENTERHRRKQFYVVIDEASRYLGEDLINGLAEMRKFGVSFCFCLQDLSAMRDKHVDMTAKVLSQCGVQMSFQQKNPEDREILADFFGYPNLNFTPLVQEVDRFDGYDWIPVEETSESISKGTNRGKSGSRTVTHGTSQMTADEHTRSVTIGNDTGESVARSKGRRTARGWDLDESESRSQTRSERRSANVSTGHGRKESRGTSESEAETGGWSEGESEGVTKGVSKKRIPLARSRVENQDQGRLQKPVNDQLAKVNQALRTLPKRHLLVSIQHSQSFPMKTHLVDDPFADDLPSWKTAHIERLKELIRLTQLCYFQPSLSTTAEEERLVSFLAETEHDSAEYNNRPRSRSHATALAEKRPRGPNGEPHGPFLP